MSNIRKTNVENINLNNMSAVQKPFTQSTKKKAFGETTNSLNNYNVTPFKSIPKPASVKRAHQIQEESCSKISSYSRPAQQKNKAFRELNNYNITPFKGILKSNTVEQMYESQEESNLQTSCHSKTSIYSKTSGHSKTASYSKTSDHSKTASYSKTSSCLKTTCESNTSNYSNRRNSDIKQKVKKDKPQQPSEAALDFIDLIDVPRKCCQKDEHKSLEQIWADENIVLNNLLKKGDLNDTIEEQKLNIDEFCAFNDALYIDEDICMPIKIIQDADDDANKSDFKLAIEMPDFEQQLDDEFPF